MDFNTLPATYEQYFLCAYVRVAAFHYLLVSLVGCLFILECLYSRNSVFTKNYLYDDYLNQDATF